MQSTFPRRWGIVGFVLGAAALSAPALAQAPSSTGANTSAGRDQRWQVQYTNSAAPSGSGFFNAYVVQSPPSPWQSNTASYQWISAAANGSIGNNPVSYTYTTTFNLAGYDPNSVSIVFRCAVDNNFVSYSLNGGTAVTSGCGDGGSTGYKFTAAQTLSSGFTSGINTLTFRATGDGGTDGLLVSIDRFQGTQTTTPEPGSIALLGTGLAGLVPVMRRKR